jgi:acyl-CoA synthetase (AMP-forming)/AMP-acid ligase II
VHQLLAEEGVTFTAAVPTVWLGLLQYLEANPDARMPKLERVVVGGSACPRIVMEKFEDKYGVTILHGWGMTEMSPVGSISRLKASQQNLPRDQQLNAKLKQGRTPYTVEMKIVDDEGKELPRDGKTFGHLVVRGPAIASAYYKDNTNILDKDGFFDTGDVATIDEESFMNITDRAKDVIKSGGEWISSIEIENIAVGHPQVAEAAVIGLPHPKWDERPLLILVRKPGQQVTKEEILKFLDGKIAKWWMPDDVVFEDEIPHTATGKIQKRDLREKFKKFKLPS